MRQVYVGDKPLAYREATAEGYIRLRRETIERILSKQVEKAEPLEVARLAGILGAKSTPQLLPLCHNIRIESVELDAWVEGESGRVGVRAKVRTHEKTGVEMEALTAVATALLNIWDIVKPYEKDEKGQYPHTLIESIRVVSKLKSEEE
ncbi:MAG: cyclic pyranopterin monophosphate synthase MoaC [Nitrososphaerota archaeon]|nr:cyclic pyranopterin monophosphate synthase MoaC [Candidatus Calditenuaceae archaeon]MDW8072958.1 cyclic pyranopterin monophosphate synthase MoaC [Nitrososphaerota archaeon]